MKKFIALLIAAAVCLSMCCCVGTSHQTDTTNEPNIPATSSSTQTEEFTEPSETQDSTQVTIQVPTPDDMPEAPTADYSLPGNERPGDRVTNTQKS